MLSNQKEAAFLVEYGAELSFTWANSAVVDNPQYSAPVTIVDGSPHTGNIIVSNPSTVSNITVFPYVSETLDNVVRWAPLPSFTVPKSPDAYNPDTVNKISCARVNVYGLFVGESIKLVAKNDTALGVADGFTAYAQIRGA